MTRVVTLAVPPAPDGVHDARLVALWVSLKASDHTRRAYAAEADRFRDFVGKPLALVTLMDVQAYAEALGQGSLKAASQNRALTAVKSLLSSGTRPGTFRSMSARP